MSESQAPSANRFYAETYDVSVPDWPGEIDFYRELAASAARAGGSVLELACGTGRVTIRLATQGARIVATDLSPEMLAVARRKSAGIAGVRWIQADMRSFQLNESFGLVIIAGHSFQHLNTPEEQMACLGCIRRHLLPGGRLVVHTDHQSVGWLAGLEAPEGSRFEDAGEFLHPTTGNQIRAFRSWSYEPSTQTAVSRARWEERDAAGAVIAVWERGPVRLHCLFRFEMEHLLARAGFTVEALYGDFARHALEDQSTEMIWLAHAVSPPA
jgi:ubiquinone/menaquinone biosynthesis C-methylase UbiE